MVVAVTADGGVRESDFGGVMNDSLPSSLRKQGPILRGPSI